MQVNFLCRKMRFIDFSCMWAIHTLTNIYTVVQYHDATLCEPSMQMACSDFIGYACCHSKWDLHVGCTHEMIQMQVLSWFLVKKL